VTLKRYILSGVKMSIKAFALAALALGSMVAGAPANATTFNWSFSGDPSFGITGSGMLTASEAGWQYVVETISGLVSDTCTGTPCVPQYHSITGLLTPHQTFGGLTNIGGDNLIFRASSVFLDNQGIVFSIGGVGSDPCAFAAGCYMNIYANAGGALPYELFVSNGGANGVNFVLTAAVPEPSTWAMMLLGFFGVGYLTYRRRGQPSAA
jgi:hypothetical protein